MSTVQKMWRKQPKLFDNVELQHRGFLVLFLVYVMQAIQTELQLRATKRSWALRADTFISLTGR